LKHYFTDRVDDNFPVRSMDIIIDRRR